MRQEPFSGSGPDGEEPDGPAPLPGAGNGSQDHPELASGPAGSGYDASASDGPPRDDDRDEAPPEEQLQGLYICLPAGQADLSGFTDGTATDPIAPGPLLAEVVTAVAGGDGAGLAEISEDCLFSVLSAARRMSSWGTWLELAAMHELAVRHPATQDRTSRQKRAAQDQPAPQDQPAVPKPADAAQDAAGAGAAVLRVSSLRQTDDRRTARKDQSRTAARRTVPAGTAGTVPGRTAPRGPTRRARTPVPAARPGKTPARAWPR